MPFLTVLLAGGLNPLLLQVVQFTLGVLVVAFVLRLFKQPVILAYIITGVVIGPSGIGWINESEMIENMGDLGLILLLFFIGMEINVTQMITNWRISVVGTLIQVALSMGVVLVIGYAQWWSIAQSLSIAFVLALSSTSVVVKYLKDNGLLHNKIGQNALGILLVQDVLIVPMMISLNYLGGHQPTTLQMILQGVGALLIFFLVRRLALGRTVALPFARKMVRDKDLQVFEAFAICFGFSLITALMGLSSALGAFVGGMVVGSSRSTQWIHDSLETLRVIFVAIFFISVGLMIDLQFMGQHWQTIGTLLLAIFLINSAINTFVMRLFKENWKESLFTAALLAQAGEFGFMIGALAYRYETLSLYHYKLVISVISLSLLFSPLWIKVMLFFSGFKAAVARLDPRNIIPVLGRQRMKRMLQNDN